MITAVKDPGALTGESRLRNLSNRMISAAPVKTLISQRCHRPKKLLEPWVRHPWSCCQDRLSRAGQQHLVTSAQTCSEMKHHCFHRELVETGNQSQLTRIWERFWSTNSPSCEICGEKSDCRILCEICGEKSDCRIFTIDLQLTLVAALFCVVHLTFQLSLFTFTSSTHTCSKNKDILKIYLYL